MCANASIFAAAGRNERRRAWIMSYAQAIDQYQTSRGTLTTRHGYDSSRVVVNTCSRLQYCTVVRR